MQTRKQLAAQNIDLAARLASTTHISRTERIKRLQAAEATAISANEDRAKAWDKVAELQEELALAKKQIMLLEEQLKAKASEMAA